MASVSNINSDNLSESRVNPQKRNILIRRLSRAPWWLLIILVGILIFAIEVSDRTHYQGAWEEIQVGITTTLRVTATAYSIALVMGLVLALLRRKSNSLLFNLFIYQPATVFVEVVRGIPTLVLLFYVVFGLSPEVVKVANSAGEWLLAQNITLLGLAEILESLTIRDIPPDWRAITALAVSYSAFLSEVFRAGLESIPQGQREAARSLGMSRGQVMRLIVLPQAVRIILPPLGNDFIAMLKESSLVSVVGIGDITHEVRGYNSATFTHFPGYNVLAMTYLTLTLGLSMIVKGIELYLHRGRETGG